MSAFQAQKGFVHFVFANQKDCYFLPSLVCTDLNGYLYYHLKKQGYEGIYFISGLEKEFTLELYDETSREIYRKHVKKTHGIKSLFGMEDSSDARVFRLPSPADFGRRITGLMKKRRNLAFVFRLDSFCEMFSGADPEFLEDLTRTGHKFLEQNGNILVFQIPMAASSSLPYLTDRKGVFAPQGESTLCPELSMILEQEHSVRLYEQLAQDMGQRCMILSSFTPEQMELAAKHIYLTEKVDLDWDARDITDLAAFLHAWYGSALLRRETGPILSENENREFRRLLRDLKDTTNWWNIRRAMEKLRSVTENNSLTDALLAYPLDEAGTGILADSLLARKIRQIRVPETLYSSIPKMGMSTLAKFSELVREYQIPRSRPVCKELESQLMQCLSYLEEAANRGDTATFERAVKSLNYGVNRRFAYEQDERRIWECYLIVLQLSEEVFQMDKLVQEDTHRLMELTAIKKSMILQIEKERKKNNLAISSGLSAEEHALSVKMHEAVNLDRQIENLTRARSMKMDLRAQKLDSLRTLELTIDNQGLGIKQNVEAILRDAVDAMERDTVKNLHAESTLEDLNRTLDAVMQEASAQSGAADVASEYEKMLRTMDDEEPMLLLDN